MTYIRRGASARASDVETKVHHVALSHDVLLSFEAKSPGLFRTGLALVRHKILVADDFGADEAVLEIRMDDAGRLGAVDPVRTVQALTSLGPAVKKVCRPSNV